MDESDNDIRATFQKIRDEAPADRSVDTQDKPILGLLAGFGLFGLVFLLNQILPGPDQANVSYDRGVRLYKEQKYDDAKQAFDRAIRLDSGMYQAYFGRAAVYQRDGETDKAIADYATVIRLKPDHADAFFNRSLIYLGLGDPDRALADLDAILRLKPDNADVYARRIAIYRDLGDFSRALADCDALVRLDDRYLPYWLDRAAVRRDDGDLDGAIRDVEAAIAISSQYADAYLHRAMLRHDKGDLDGALADLAQAIAIKPDDLRASVARGEVFRDMGRIDDAKGAFDGVIARSKDIATGYMQRGALKLFALGDAAAAADDLDVAVRKGFEFRNWRNLFNTGIRYAEEHFAMVPTPTDNRPMLAPDVLFVPSIYDLVVWRHIARIRAGQADDDFKSDGSRLDVDIWRESDLVTPPVRTDWRHRVTWPGQIVALFAGRTTPQTVRRAAEAAPGAFQRRLRLCEADFYLGEYQLEKGATDAARKLLQSAAEGCPASAPEAGFAKSELKRIGTQP